jgi:ATP-dependent helicase HrpA
MAANRDLRARLVEVEERTRRRDILLDDEAIFHFYDRGLPRDVANTRDFEGWWKKARVETPDLLLMREEDLLDEEPVDLVESDFPREWVQGDQTLALSYRFEPGASDDGVTVTVPLPLLAGLRSDGFDWQVPGLREELVTALIKALPKHIRKNVVPAGDWARKLLATLEPSSEPIAAALAREIQAQTYTPVSAADFDWSRVPEHLKVGFAVADARGAVIQRGKSLSALQAGLKPAARESVAKVVDAPRPADRVERSGITTWDFGDLDRMRDTEHGGNRIRAYPALVDEGSTVAVRLQSTPADQAAAHRRGVLRLLVLSIPSPTGYVQEHLTTQEKLALAHSPYRTTAELFEDCLVACIADVVDPGEIFTEAQFQAARTAVSSGLVDALFSVVGQVSRILAATREADKAIRDATSMALIAPLGDARSQLDALVFPGFVSRAGLARLRRYPLYLQGLIHRVARLAENVGRDRVWMQEVQQATARYIEAGGTLPLAADAPENLARVRWMLEELRLSLFAQHLGTDGPVSLQRITKALTP